MLVGTIVVVMGIAVATAVSLFTVFDGLVFRPLPFEHAARTVHLSAPPTVFRALLYEEVQSVVDSARSTPLLTNRAKVTFARIGATFEPGSEALIDWGLRPVYVSPAFFSIFGRPEFGRPFDDSDARRNKSDAPLMVSRQVARRLGVDGHPLPRQVRIPGTPLDRPWTLVGIMPEGFAFPAGANVWIPHDRRFPEEADIPTYAVLADGVTIEQIRGVLPHVVVTPLREQVTPAGALGFGVLLGGTMLLLGTALVQVAALLFARSAQDATEMAIRLALGATRLAIARRSLVEASLISTAACLLAVLATPAILHQTVGLLPTEMTAGQDLRLDRRALFFTGGIGALSIVLLSLAASVIVLRITPAAVLRNSLSVIGRPEQSWMRSIMIATQVAITIVLLYGAAMAALSARAVRNADIGFDPARLVAVRLPLPTMNWDLSSAARAADRERQRQLYPLTRDAVRDVAGVLSLATANSWPLEGFDSREFPFWLRGEPEQPIAARMRSVDAEYLRTIGGTIVMGRDFSESIDVDASSVLINEAFARKLKSNKDVVNRQLGSNRQVPDDIVGIFKDIPTDRPDEPSAPEVLTYVRNGNVLLARIAPGKPTEARAAILEAVRRIWGNRAPREVVDLGDEVERATTDYRARATVLWAVSLASIPLALCGIWAAISHNLQRRASEISLRLVLGATTHDIRTIVWRRTISFVVGGVAVGLTSAWQIADYLRSAIYGVDAIDPFVSSLIAVAVLFLAVCAAEVPIVRMLRTDLVSALRET